MIEDIKKLGLSDNMYNELIEVNGYDLVLNMACNYELIANNVNLLRGYGIFNIYPILLHKNHILMYDSDYIVDKFRDVNISDMAKMINEDYTAIDFVFNN